MHVPVDALARGSGTALNKNFLTGIAVSSGMLNSTTVFFDHVLIQKVNDKDCKQVVPLLVVNISQDHDSN